MQQPPWGQGAPAPAQVPPYVPAQALAPGASDEEGVSVLRAIKAVFQSPNWKTNILLGLVLLLIPIVGPIALGGWMCESHQRWVRRHPDPFPKIDFGDFGDYIKRGLAPFLTGLIIGIPIMQLILFGFAINSDPRNLPAVVRSADNSVFARDFVVSLKNSGYFAIVGDTDSAAHVLAIIKRAAAMLRAQGREVQLVFSVPLREAAFAEVAELGMTFEQFQARLEQDMAGKDPAAP